MAQTVLFITRKWPPAVGGMETYSKRLSEELARHVSLDLLALPGRADGRPPSMVSLLIFGLRAALHVMRAAPHCDVAHGADMALWPLVFLAKLRNPKACLVLSAHGTDVAYANRKGVRAFCYRRYLRLGARLLKRARVIANSRATAALLEGHGYRAPAIAPLAADGPAPQAAPEQPEPYLLFVGRLIERKGCGWFIKEILPRVPDGLRLKVAGTIIDESERAALGADRVDYLGPVFGAELDGLRRNALAVIVPNITQANAKSFEGFGLTAVEGAAAGGVVLAASVDGVADAVKDGETGFLLPAGDASSWADKIHEIAGWTASRRQSFLGAAATAVKHHYSWGRVAADTIACYGEPSKRISTAPNNAAPLISVVMPAYNAEKYLESAIDSILAQTLDDFEFLIIDDCSTDATPNILAKAAAADPRIRILRNSENLGVSRSLNRGFAEATGRYVARMDADDISLPRRFEQQAQFLNENPGHSFVACGYKMIDGDGRVTRSGAESESALECDWISIFRMPVIHPAMMIRRHSFQQLDEGYKPETDGAEDFDFTQRLLRIGRGQALNASLFYYRMHDQNISTVRKSVQARLSAEIAAANACLRFPEMDPASIRSLFSLLLGADGEKTDFALALSALKEIESAFIAHARPAPPQLKRMRLLIARWLVKGAIANAIARRPRRLASFMWTFKTYLKYAPHEAWAYLQRRRSFGAAPAPEPSPSRITSAGQPRPMISVVMAVMNEENYVEAAIDSILSQTLSDFEFLIIDDGSTDATPQILARYAERDPRIRILTNEVNIGVPKSLNRGLHASKGSYIARMDADDISFPLRFEAQARFLDANPDHILTGAGHQIIDSEGAITSTHPHGSSWWEFAWTAFFRPPLIHSSAMYRAEIIRAHQIYYDHAFNRAADYEFWHRLLNYGKGCEIPGIHVQYRMHSQNVSTKHRDKQHEVWRRASILNAERLFPDIAPALFEAAYTYFQAKETPSFDVVKQTIECLQLMEEKFASSKQLNARQRNDIRNLSSRWLIVEAMRSGVFGSFSSFNSFASASSPYRSPMAAELLRYIGRKVAAPVERAPKSGQATRRLAI